MSSAGARAPRRVRIALRATATVGSAIGITAAVLVYGRSLDDDRQATAAASEPLASFAVEPLGIGQPATPPITVARGAGDRAAPGRAESQQGARPAVLAVVRTPDGVSAAALGDRLAAAFGSHRTIADVAPGAPGDGIRGVIVLDALDLFVPGTAELTLDGRLDLVAVAALVRTFRGAVVDVVGHTDSLGAAGRNVALSTDWADAAAALIRTETAGAVRVHPTGRGAREPLTDNETADGRRRNNRIEIVFHDPEREELTSSGPR
jgi:outer membrane protein OmpA-like peptidoglycan-associated protein